MATFTAPSARGTARRLVARYLDSCYVSSVGTSYAVSLGKALLYARLLGAAPFGVYSLAYLIVSLATAVSTLGVGSALLRQVPVLRGQNNEPGAITIRNSLMSAALLFSGGIGLVICAIVLLAGGRAAPRTLLLAAPLSILSTQFKLLTVDLRGRQRSAELGVVLLLNSASSLGLGLCGLRIAGVTGTLIGETSVLAVLLLVVIGTRVRDLHYTVPRVSGVVQHVLMGLPFTLTNFLNALALNLTGWAIALVFGKQVFGEYSLGMILFTMGSGLQDVLTTTILPAALLDYGRNGEIRPVVRKAQATAVAVFAFYATMAIPAWIAFAWFMSRFCPTYHIVVGLAPYIYLASMFECANLYEMVYLAARRGVPLVTISAISLGLMVLADTILGLWRCPAWLFVICFASYKAAVLAARAFFGRRFR